MVYGILIPRPNLSEQNSRNLICLKLKQGCIPSKLYQKVYAFGLYAGNMRRIILTTICQASPTQRPRTGLYHAILIPKVEYNKNTRAQLPVLVPACTRESDPHKLYMHNKLYDKIKSPKPTNGSSWLLLLPHSCNQPRTSQSYTRINYWCGVTLNIRDSKTETLHVQSTGLEGACLRVRSSFPVCRLRKGLKKFTPHNSSRE